MQKITVDWSRTRDKIDIKPAATRFRWYLERIGLEQNTIKLYIALISQTAHPAASCGVLIEDKWSGRSIDGFCPIFILVGGPESWRFFKGKDCEIYPQSKSQETFKLNDIIVYYNSPLGELS